jgi:glycosyltransferase involved in cell wall biosynthesis
LINLSVMIITYNEEENIRQCLESVEWAGEIVVVDSFSTDQTLRISREYTDKVFERAWEGFGPQKQFALEQTTLDWVLSIDADERVSTELKEEILSSWDRLENDAYDIPFHFYWLGKRLRFSGYRKERHVRLFRRQKARFEGFVHEKLLIEGEKGRLHGPMVHLSYKNIEDYFDKFNLYSTLVARQKYETGKGISFQLQIVGCLWDFFHRYFLKLGLLDGMPGFLWAVFSSFHRLVKYAKLWEMKRERREP